MGESRSRLTLRVALIGAWRRLRFFSFEFGICFRSILYVYLSVYIRVSVFLQIKSFWMYFDEIFEEQRPCIRDKLIKFWTGSRFFREPWINFQDS